ncbi:Transcriptional regulator RFX1 [Cytospora mali]|uniref:Transcriptional regulator RFX1 n=1 Tax=Cytospora mali TaxID=578113 RepID=A0A194UYS4_CYTMA|nr:Transcriptional regulator RFX1 [Valsa mali var. pyri (nom. inval.)]
MHNGMGSQFRFQAQPQIGHMGRQSLPADSFMSVNSHPGMGSQIIDRNDSPAPDSGLDVGNAPTRARSNTNNDQEMRDLFNRNSHRALQDVAKELHGNERGPSSERCRQLFAMLWIKSACRKGKTSVPRSRVYANYVKRCAHEKIAVLNPASFGKLVRVLYPGLRTRRLGVRGESKYHYVDFELIDEDIDIEESPSQVPASIASGPSFVDNLNLHNVTRPSTATEGEKPVLLSAAQNEAAASGGNQATQNVGSRDLRHAIYNHPQVQTTAELGLTGSKTLKLLCLELEDSSKTPTRLILPPIEPYLPPGTDSDAAKSLEALYLSHCTSLIECIRFCKEKNFFHLFTAFHGTLTVPVQKLLANPALEPWIEQCDLRMYQNMMQIVSVVALQVIPPFGLQSLRNISEKLVSHIRHSFEGQPYHIFRAKEAPAALFADLLDRSLRVNTTAHATANFLHNHANRTQMYLDFITFVRPRKIAQSVPLEGMEDVVDLLVSDIRQLLDPRDVPWELERCTVQGDFFLHSRKPEKVEREELPESLNILDRWVDFLRALPGRFPYASHADIVQFVQTIGTTIMRDLTISSADSFGAWWCLKCFLDEMVWFLAEKGGFMKQNTTQAVETSKRKHIDGSTGNEKRKTMRYSSGSASDDAILALMDNSHQVLAGLQNENQHVVLDINTANYDDSGISMRMSGEDSPMSKFTNHMESQRIDGQNMTNGLS